MHDAAALEAIAPDWPYLTGELHLTDSQADIFDRGEQVVGSFRSRRGVSQPASFSHRPSGRFQPAWFWRPAVFSGR